jgi:hypothetical protein
MQKLIVKFDHFEKCKSMNERNKRNESISVFITFMKELFLEFYCKSKKKHETVVLLPLQNVSQKQNLCEI